MGSTVKDEQLKRLFKKALPGLPSSGNEFWKWASKYGTPDDSFLMYMSKGILRPKYLKNFSDTLVEERRQQWKITTPKAESSQKYDEYEELLKAFYAQHDDYTLRTIQLVDVRKWVFSWYFKRDGKAPHLSNYKRYACSVYVKSREKVSEESFQNAVSDVINLWY